VSPQGDCFSQCFLVAPLADADAGNRPLLLATTHLKAKGGAACDAVRRAEAEQLAQHLAQRLEAAGPGAAALLAGDFNTELGSDAMEALRRASGLQAVPLLPAPDGSAFTTWKFRSPRAPGNGNGNGDGNGNHCESGVPLAGAGFGAEGGEKVAAIDHVFHSAALRPTAAWAAPGRGDCGAAGLPCAAYPSDHVAQCVELTWLDER
jgi:endonuclease/exonuclease/phosphatase family metal-dependent hydrolase